MYRIFLYMAKSTILVETGTRKLLKQIGTKGQTYDQVIKELIKTIRSHTRSEDIQSSQTTTV